MISLRGRGKKGDFVNYKTILPFALYIWVHVSEEKDILR